MKQKYSNDPPIFRGWKWISGKGWLCGCGMLALSPPSINGEVELLSDDAITLPPNKCEVCREHKPFLIPPLRLSKNRDRLFLDED